MSLAGRAPQGKESRRTAIWGKRRNARCALQVFSVLVAQVNVANVKQVNFALVARRLRGAAPQAVSATSPWHLAASLCGALLRNFAMLERIAHQVRHCRYRA